jgi:hemolysin III
VLALGLGLGAVGGGTLFARAIVADGADRLVAAVGIYAVALPAMFLSALLFGAARDTLRRGFLRRLDHATIFALIAATATPFVIAAPAAGGIGFVAVIWVAAAVGIFVKFRYPIGSAPRSAAIFGLSGWVLMVALAPMIALRRALFLVLLGSVLYTIGTPFYVWRRLRFHRAIWHAFVFVGAAAHFLAVAAILGWRPML